MARSSLTYIPGFSVKFFFQPIYTDYANKAYFDKRSHLNLLLWNHWTKLNQTWQGWPLGGSLSKRMTILLELMCCHSLTYIYLYQNITTQELQDYHYLQSEITFPWSLF